MWFCFGVSFERLLSSAKVQALFPGVAVQECVQPHKVSCGVKAVSHGVLLLGSGEPLAPILVALCPGLVSTAMC